MLGVLTILPFEEPVRRVAELGLLEFPLPVCGCCLLTLLVALVDGALLFRLVAYPGRELLIVERDADGRRFPNGVLVEGVALFVPNGRRPFWL